MSRQWKPPDKAATMAADLMVQGFDAAQIAEVIDEKMDLGLVGVRRKILLEAAEVIVCERAQAYSGIRQQAAVARLQHLYRKALGAGEYRAALEVHRDLQRLEAQAAETGAPAAEEPPAPYSFADSYRQSMADKRGG